MYFVWKTEIRAFHGQTIRAELRPFRDDSYRIDKFSCQPIRDLLPERLEYDVNLVTDPLPDEIFTASNFTPHSDRLVNLIKSTGLPIEDVPAVLWKKGTNSILSENYRYVHVMNCVEAADIAKCRGDIKDIKGKTFISRVKRLVLKKEFVESNIPIFRLAEATRFLLVHQSFKDAYKAAGMIGGLFTPIEDFRDM